MDDQIETLDDTPWPYIPDSDPPTITLDCPTAQRLLKALCSGFLDTRLTNLLAEQLGDHICHPLEARPDRRRIILTATQEAAQEQDMYRRGYTKGYEIGLDIGRDSGLTDGTRDGYSAGYHDGQAGNPPNMPTRQPDPNVTLFQKAKAKRGLNPSLFDASQGTDPRPPLAPSGHPTATHR